MKILGDFFSLVYNYCFALIGNEWLTVVLFTLLSKLIMLPIAIVVQINSIKMVKMYPEINRIKTKYFGNKEMISEKQYDLYQKEKYHPVLDIIPAIIQLVVLMGVVKGFPKDAVNRDVMMVLGAAVSSLVLCVVQNKINVLQHEQSKTNQISVLLFSVSLSLFLALFVSKLVVFYWICSNIMSAIQIFLMNLLINPKKHIDYIELQKTKEDLENIKKQNEQHKVKRSKELIKRENSDYKRFINFENKQVVFYSERNGFYKYYKDIIEVILKKTDIIIHYITSDPNDEIFKLTNENFKTYYIEEKLMILMMRMDADIVVMTTPDLQNYYIKRSMIRDDIEYIYVDHATNSMNLMYHKDALAHFDTIFIQNKNNFDEIRAQEEKYGFKKKNLVKVGFPLIDNMIKAYNGVEQNHTDNKTILIAPSWQEDNIFDSCVDELIENLLKTDYTIVLRPHPQYLKLFPEKATALKNRYVNNSRIIFEDDFSSNKTVYDADILISDWSGVALEYAFTTLKPVIFINTPMKVINKDYKDINIVPFNIESRHELGAELELNNINKINDVIKEFETNKKYSKERIGEIRDKYLYNIGNSCKYGAKYIIDSLIKKSEMGQEKEENVAIDKEDETNYTFKTKFINSFICNLFVCLTIFFFSPMEVYLGNYADFLFPINNVWWILLLFALLIAAIIAGIVSILPKTISKILNYLEFVFGLACYTQIIFLNGYVESLFTTNVDVVQFSKPVVIVNILIWLLLFVISIVAFIKIIVIRKNTYKIITYLGICLIIVQLFGFFSSYSKIPSKVNKTNYLTNTGEFVLSNNNNTIVFLLDYCDGEFVEPALEMYPDLFDGLDGFTYYPDFVTTYGRTYPSVVYLLTGEKCYFDLPAEEYIDEAWTNTNNYEYLKKNDYNVGVYTHAVFASESSNKYIDNFNQYNSYALSSIDVEALIKEMTVLSLYRTMPYYIKTIINEKYPINVDRIAKMPDDNCIQYDDPLMYSTLLENGLATSKDYENAFRFYHLRATHGNLNINVELPEDNEEQSTSTTLYANFKILKEYIKEMKRLGIYEDSTIIITTDHGRIGNNLKNGDIVTGLLLVKKAGDSNGFTTNDTSLSHNEIIDYVFNNNEDALGEDINRIRYHHQYSFDEDGNYYLHEFEINGNAKNSSNWKMTDNKWIIKYDMYE